MKITKTIEQPEEVINGFADSLGYQEVISNPAFVGSIDPDTNEFTDNGEAQTIPNPQSRLEYISAKTDDVLLAFLTQFAEQEARQEAEGTIEATVKATKDALAAALSTTL